MKNIFTIWIIINSFIFAQADCKDFKTLFKTVDKNYAELSQQPFPNYVKYTLSQKDSIKVSLYNVKGEIVYQENYGLLDANTYVIKFFNPECAGIYIASTEIGKQQAYKKSILITSEEYIPNGIEMKLANSSSIVNGVWKRSYSERFIPPIQPQTEGYKIEYHYKYDLTVSLSKNDYKIISERTDENNGGKETKVYEGKYAVYGDTLKLFKDSKLNKIFHYKVESDTLTLTYFTHIDKRNGIGVVSMERNFSNQDIKLNGKYYK